MRCLNCGKDGLRLDTEICPQCGVYLPSLLRDVLPSGTVVGGKYQIAYALGRGGFGVTYQAIHRSLEQVVAIKEFFPNTVVRQGTTSQIVVPTTEAEAFERGLKRFRREGQTLARLKHPNVVGVNDYFEERGTAYLVMEYVRGKTLRKEIEEQGGGMSPERVREIGSELVKALAAVHEEKVYHLDIKPDNVLLTPEGRVVLVDFGAARQGFRETRSISTQALTVDYAPPELFGKKEVGPESDIFELGMTLHEMLTGELPPSVFGRMVGDTWQPTELEEPWRGLVAAALQLEQEARPKEIEKWWKAGMPKSSRSSREPVERGEERRREKPAEEKERVVSGAGKRGRRYEFEVVTLDSRGREVNRRRGETQGYVEDLGKGIELEMVEIPGGSFVMGSPPDEGRRDDDEGPQRRVTVRGFYMGRFPVTQEQYEAVMGTNPSLFKGAKRPVEKVSWHDAKKYCDRLTEATGREYRLPSEAEWEYACRAGTTTPFHFGETISTDVANYDGRNIYGNGRKGEYRQETTEVGKFPANGYGVHDMHGNVWEWCEDMWHENYKGAPTDGSAWLSGRNNRYCVIRGGSWHFYPGNCRCANRFRNIPGYRSSPYGFRVVSSTPRT